MLGALGVFAMFTLLPTVVITQAFSHDNLLSCILTVLFFFLYHIQ